MSDITELPQSVFTLQPAMLLGLYVMAGVYVIFSSVLYYHWQSYSTDDRVTRITLITFFISTFPLLLIMALILLTV